MRSRRGRRTSLVARNLLRSEHRILERLGRGETQPRARGNIDRLAGGGIAADTRLGLALAEDAQSRQAQSTFFLELFDHETGELFESRLPLLLGNPDFFREMSCDLGLRHHPPP